MGDNTSSDSDSFHSPPSEISGWSNYLRLVKNDSDSTISSDNESDEDDGVVKPSESESVEESESDSDSTSDDDDSDYSGTSVSVNDTTNATNKARGTLVFRKNITIEEAKKRKCRFQSVYDPKITIRRNIVQEKNTMSG